MVLPLSQSAQCLNTQGSFDQQMIREACLREDNHNLQLQLQKEKQYCESLTQTLNTILGQVNALDQQAHLQLNASCSRIVRGLSTNKNSSTTCKSNVKFTETSSGGVDDLDQQRYLLSFAAHAGAWSKQMKGFAQHLIEQQQQYDQCNTKNLCSSRYPTNSDCRNSVKSIQDQTSEAVLMNYSDETSFSARDVKFDSASCPSRGKKASAGDNMVRSNSSTSLANTVKKSSTNNSMKGIQKRNKSCGQKSTSIHACKSGVSSSCANSLDAIVQHRDAVNSSLKSKTSKNTDEYNVQQTDKSTNGAIKRVKGQKTNLKKNPAQMQEVVRVVSNPHKNEEKAKILRAKALRSVGLSSMSDSEIHQVIEGKSESSVVLSERLQIVIKRVLRLLRMDGGKMLMENLQRKYFKMFGQAIDMCGHKKLSYLLSGWSGFIVEICQDPDQHSDSLMIRVNPCNDEPSKRVQQRLPASEHTDENQDWTHPIEAERARTFHCDQDDDDKYMVRDTDKENITLQSSRHPVQYCDSISPPPMRLHQKVMHSHNAISTTNDHQENIFYDKFDSENSLPLFDSRFETSQCQSTLKDSSNTCNYSSDKLRSIRHRIVSNSHSPKRRKNNPLSDVSNKEFRHYNQPHGLPSSSKRLIGPPSTMSSLPFREPYSPQPFVSRHHRSLSPSSSSRHRIRSCTPPIPPQTKPRTPSTVFRHREISLPRPSFPEYHSSHQRDRSRHSSSHRRDRSRHLSSPRHRSISPLSSRHQLRLPYYPQRRFRSRSPRLSHHRIRSPSPCLSTRRTRDRSPPYSRRHTHSSRPLSSPQRPHKLDRIPSSSHHRITSHSSSHHRITSHSSSHHRITSHTSSLSHHHHHHHHHHHLDRHVSSTSLHRHSSSTLSSSIRRVRSYTPPTSRHRVSSASRHHKRSRSPPPLTRSHSSVSECHRIKSYPQLSKRCLSITRSPSSLFPPDVKSSKKKTCASLGNAARPTLKYPLRFSECLRLCSFVRTCPFFNIEKGCRKGRKFCSKKHMCFLCQEFSHGGSTCPKLREFTQEEPKKPT